MLLLENEFDLFWCIKFRFKWYKTGRVTGQQTPVTFKRVKEALQLQRKMIFCDKAP